MASARLAQMLRMDPTRRAGAHRSCGGAHRAGAGGTRGGRAGGAGLARGRNWPKVGAGVPGSADHEARAVCDLHAERDHGTQLRRLRRRPGDTISNFSNRMDADAIAYWELRNLGFGEAAARGRSTVHSMRQATINRLATLDQVGAGGGRGSRTGGAARADRNRQRSGRGGRRLVPALNTHGSNRPRACRSKPCKHCRPSSRPGVSCSAH